VASLSRIVRDQGIKLAMATDVAEISTLHELRDLVQKAFCDRQQRLLGAFRLQERILVRHGDAYGLHFILYGPRAVRFSALWDAAGRTILFYNCNGDRFHRRDLTVSRRLQAELVTLTRRSAKMAA
jgi:hypothetical protein